MRRLLGFCLLASFATCVSALEVDGNITVEVKKIRNKRGNILVMAQINENSEPIYGFAEITGHTVEVTLKGTGAQEYVISVFHDEMVTGNWIRMNVAFLLRDLPERIIRQTVMNHVV